MHIAIAGNIGAGKTTLTQLLAKHYKWEAQLEDVVDNPYLDDFYNQMERWSFNLQVYFLNSRFRQVLQIRKSGKDIIQDRTIYEDANIFAPNLHAMGLMTNRDFENYSSLFNLMESLVEAPDLLIYLRSSIPNLVSQIHKRGRDYENSISIDYLSRLNERYEAWIHGYKKGRLLVIDVDDLDFVENKEDLGGIIKSPFYPDACYPLENKLLIGATLNHHELGGKEEELFLKDFKFLCPANAAKQQRVYPRPGVWQWDRIDEFLEFSKTHNLSVRIHGPISPQASKWAKEDRRTAEELEDVMIEFMTASAKRYNQESTVHYMDVVNETILPDGSWFGPKPGTDRWENPWLTMGLDENGIPNYIVKAFEIATKHAPNVKLVYNQNAGMQKPIWDKVKETILYLRNKGLRVDGIGLFWQA